MSGPNRPQEAGPPREAAVILASRRCGRGLAGLILRRSYERPRPAPACQDLQERNQSAERRRPRGRGGGFLRPARPERRRQDDRDRHRHLARQQDQRHRPSVRPRHRHGHRGGEILHRARSPGDQLQHVRDLLHHRRQPGRLLRNSAAAREAAGREIPEAAAAVGSAQFHRPLAVGRHEAAADDRSGSHARAEAADPGRADGREVDIEIRPLHVGIPAQHQRCPARPSISPPPTISRRRRICARNVAIIEGGNTSSSAIPWPTCCASCRRRCSCSICASRAARRTANCRDTPRCCPDDHTLEIEMSKTAEPQ